MKITSHFKEKNSNYYVVQFDFEELYTPLDPNEIDEIKWWCYKNFGAGLGAYRLENSPFIHRWINNIEFGEIKFSSKQDLDWFLLKWN